MGRALVCLLLRLLGILNLNGTTLKKGSQPLDFIHASHSSDALHQEPNASFINNDSGAFVQDGAQKQPREGGLDKHGTEQRPSDARPAAERRAAGSAGADCDPKDVARMEEHYVIGKKRRTSRHSETSHPSQRL